MCNNKGGVALYVKSEITFQRQKDMEPDNLECIVISVDVEGKSHLYVVNLYRPPQMQMSTLQTSLRQIFSCIPADSKVVLIGDFNVNPNSTDHLLHVMKPLADFSLVQKITTPTHRLGSVLDHVYVPSSFSTAPTLVLPMYFTDHSAVVITLPLSSSTSSQNLCHGKNRNIKNGEDFQNNSFKENEANRFPSMYGW